MRDVRQATFLAFLAGFALVGDKTDISRPDPRAREVLVCLSCGERYYDKKAMRRIEEIRTKLKGHDLKVKEVGKIWVEQVA